MRLFFRRRGKVQNCTAQFIQYIESAFLEGRGSKSRVLSPNIEFIAAAM
jgi:hypothetical protein